MRLRQAISTFVKITAGLQPTERIDLMMHKDLLWNDQQDLPVVTFLFDRKLRIDPGGKTNLTDHFQRYQVAVFAPGTVPDFGKTKAVELQVIITFVIIEGDKKLYTAVVMDVPIIDFSRSQVFLLYFIFQQNRIPVMRNAKLHLGIRTERRPWLTGYRFLVQDLHFCHEQIGVPELTTLDIGNV